jgi:hypothetical protein
MAFLTINGVTVPIASDGASIDVDTVGEGFARAQGGAGRMNFQAYKQHVKLHTTPMTQAEAFAWFVWLSGQHDHWGFAADLYSDKGYGPSSSTLATQGTGGRNGSSKLTLGATTGAIAYTGSFVTGIGFTLLVGRFESAAWHDYALTWSPVGTLTAVYRDGVAQAVALPTWLTFTYATSSFSLLNTAGTAQDFCELAHINAPAPASWLAQLSAWRASNNQPTTPRLTAAGDIHPTTLTVFGKVGSAKNMMGALNGAAFADNLRVLDFELMES